MAETISVSTSLTAIHCGECGGTYALDSRYYKEKTECGGFWICPYCRCEWGIPADGTEIARLKRKLEYQEAQTDTERRRLHSERDRHTRTQRQLSATRGVVTRTKKRIACGTCPCCKRRFTNLQRHMETQHPKYAGD